MSIPLEEEFEDIKGVIRIGIFKKNRQHRLFQKGVMHNKLDIFFHIDNGFFI